jgi:hypothetical protein
MPTTDNDAEMLRTMANAITDLQVKYRAASLDDQAILATPLMELLGDYGNYQARLLKAGTITDDSELAEMAAIRQSITDNATRQDLLLAIARIIALIASA